MKVDWEDVKSDYARKDEEIASLKRMVEIQRAALDATKRMVEIQLAALDEASAVMQNQSTQINK